jgi:predicted aspartyl protease
VTVEVNRQGPDASKLRVETGPISEFETLRVIYPDDTIVFRSRNWRGRSEMYVRDDGTFGGGWNNRDRDRGRRVQVRSSGTGLEAHADVRVLVPAGKEVGVYLGGGEITASNVNGNIRLDTGAGDVTAEGMKGTLFVDTGSGEVAVTTVEGDELNIDTGSGSVSVNGAQSRTVNIDTGSGNVEGRNISCTELSVDTGSGSIELTEVRASRLNMDTGSGDVTVSLLSDSDDLMVDTGSGSVTVEVPANFGSAIDLSTSSGDIETEIEMQVTRRGRQQLNGRIGDGQGRMTIETGSGNVTIRRSR